MFGQRGFFAVEDRDIWLREAGDPLEKFEGGVWLGTFPQTLVASAQGFLTANGENQPFEAVMMFKILML